MGKVCSKTVLEYKVGKWKVLEENERK